MNWVTDNEIAFKNEADAFAVARLLLKNGYAVMITDEEKLTIVNFVWTPNYANRNGVVFQARDIIEEEVFKTE